MINLHPHQQTVYDRMAPDESYLVVLPYGGGKSPIALLRALLQHNRSWHDALAMIFVENDFHVLNWKQALRKFAPHLRVVDLSQAGGPLDSDRIHRDWDVVLVRHPQVRSQYERLYYIINDRQVCALIFDESTAIKNSRSQIGEAACGLALHHHKVVDHGIRLCLTGRADPESPFDVYNQIRFCRPADNPLGKTPYACLKKYFVQHDHGWSLSMDRELSFWAAARKASVYFNEQEQAAHNAHLGINDVIYQTVLFEPTAQQLALLEMLRRTWSLPATQFDTIRDLKKDSLVVEEYVHNMSVMQKARQIASGFYYTNSDTPVSVRTNKFDAIVDVADRLLVEEPTRKIVIWHYYEHEQYLLAQAFFKHARLRDITIAGNTPGDVESFADLSPSSPRVIIASSKLAKGLNDLVVADTAIFASNDYGQELRDQQESRLKRPGQRSKAVMFIDVVGNGLLDAEVVAHLQAKDLTGSKLNALVERWYPNKINC